MFSLTLTKVLLTSLGCGLAVKQVAYGECLIPLTLLIFFVIHSIILLFCSINVI